jgi:acyl dehydratase
MSERDPVAETGTVASILNPDRDARRSTVALYLDDLRVGQRFTSGSLRVEEAEKAFAARFDPQPFHLDESAARASMFGGLAASGWHTAALSMRLLVDGGAPIAGGVIGASGELAWPRPARPGDVLTVETEVLQVVPSKSAPTADLLLFAARPAIRTANRCRSSREAGGSATAGTDSRRRPEETV